jgi:hypothetical protein
MSTKIQHLYQFAKIYLVLFSKTGKCFVMPFLAGKWVLPIGFVAIN